MGGHLVKFPILKISLQFVQQFSNCYMKIHRQMWQTSYLFFVQVCIAEHTKSKKALKYTTYVKNNIKSQK